MSIKSLSDGDLGSRAALNAAYAAKVNQNYAVRGFPVATNCYGSGTTNALGAASGTSRSPHYTAADACDLRLVYGNSYVNASLADTPGANTLTVSASVEYSGTIYRVTFGGRTSTTIDPGGYATTDPLGIEIPAGTLFFVRTYVSATVAPNGNVASYFGGGTGGFAASTDLTAPGSGAVADSVAWLYAPYAITGTPTSRTAPSVLIIGDSIAAGYADQSGGYAEGPTQGGYITRGLGNAAGRVNIANPSDTVANFVAIGNRYRRITLGGGCTHAICEYGINDVKAGVSLATLQTNLTAAWNLLVRRGMKVWQTTITPYTTSTDSWATVANQTPVNSAHELVRTQLNDWIRTKPAPLAGYFEAADLAESGRNSGKWKAGYTGDGLHPNTGTGSPALAAAVSASSLA